MAMSDFFDSLEPRKLMSAAEPFVDPVTENNPLWIAQFGTVTVDGRLTGREWAHAEEVFRTQPYHTNSSIRVMMLHNNQGLFIGADIRDEYLWADGDGDGEGGRWKVEQDDSITFFFDPDNSADQFLQDGDRAISFNLAGMDAPETGDGAVSRWKFIKGNGDGTGRGVNQYGLLDDGIAWATEVRGTVNDNSDTDDGWSVELFIPWASLNMDGSPRHGQTIGMNFDAIFDTEGGTRDLANNSNSENPDERFGPTITDDHITGVHSSFISTQAGFEGPANFAQLMFVNPRHTARTNPQAIANLVASNVTGYGVRLDFSSPAATPQGDGHVSRYEIRMVEGEAFLGWQWKNATIIDNAFTPKLAGLSESLRLGELTPDTTYTIAIRAADAAGNLGALSTVTFTTQTTEQDTSGGLRVMPSPMGGAMMTEAGDPFLINGDHFVPSYAYVRGLYPGDVWFDDAKEIRNFADRDPVEGPFSPHIDQLAASGVTTMRAVLEMLPISVDGQVHLPHGNYWLEGAPGEFNPAMRAYLHNLMAEADRAGIYLTLHPFNTFNYRDYFDLTAFSSANGGPLDSIDDFFQTPEVLDMAKARVETIMDWVNQSPFAHRVIGIEMVNEWDSWGWTLNPKSDGDPSRADEMRDRAQFVTELAEHARTYDPNMSTISSSIGLAPRGPVARALYLSGSFDVLAPHFYTASSEEPVNNPDTDRSFKPARDVANLAAYWQTQSRSRTPIYNGEWGLTQRYFTDTDGNNRSYYNGTSPAAPNARPFFQTEDEDQFRTIAWASIATGLQGPGNRIAGPELRDLVTIADLDPEIDGALPLHLSDAMRDTQASVSAFFQGAELQLDTNNYAFTPLTGMISFDRTGGADLHAWGSTDGSQGMVYVIQDRNNSTGSVAPHILVSGLKRGQVYDAEVWSTGADAHVIKTIVGQFGARGTVRFKLPTFDHDVIVKFKARDRVVENKTVAATEAGRRLVTFSLDETRRPVAEVVDTQTGEIEFHNIAAMSRFTGQLVDLVAYERPGGKVTMVAADVNNEIWLFNGTPANGPTAWDPAKNLSDMRDLPGVTGGLTATTVEIEKGNGQLRRQFNIFGIDDRGQIMNYESSPLFGWVFRDFARRGANVTVEGGLSAFQLERGIAGVSAVGEDGSLYVFTRDQAFNNKPNEAWSSTNLTTTFEAPTARGSTSSTIVGGTLTVAFQDSIDNVWTFQRPVIEATNWSSTNVSAASGLGRVDGSVTAIVTGNKVDIFASFLGGAVAQVSGLNSDWSHLYSADAPGEFDVAHTNGEISLVAQRDHYSPAMRMHFDGTEWRYTNAAA